MPLTKKRVISEYYRGVPYNKLTIYPKKIWGNTITHSKEFPKVMSSCKRILRVKSLINTDLLFHVVISTLFSESRLEERFWRLGGSTSKRSFRWSSWGWGWNGPEPPFWSWWHGAPVWSATPNAGRRNLSGSIFNAVVSGCFYILNSYSIIFQSFKLSLVKVQTLCNLKF